MLLIVLAFLAILSTKETLTHSHNYTPALTVVIIVDQFSPQYFRHSQYFSKNGFNRLLKNGVVYKNARHMHGWPTTPTGHAAIATGAYACIHGFASYGNLDSTNKFIEITRDLSGENLTYKSDGSLCKEGISPRNLLVDTVSDQFVMSCSHNQKVIPHEAAAFALKTRACVPLAGNLGKAFWFDDGCMTTSQFYEKKYPDLLKKFNGKFKLKQGQQFHWKLVHGFRDAAYQYPEVLNYKNSAVKPGVKNTVSKFTIDYKNHETLAEFSRSPFASKMLFNLARYYIARNRKKNLLVYISLSNFDLLGHLVGPDNLHQIDLLYHIDRQLADFLEFAEKCYGSKKVLTILTGDHGVSHLPEVLNNQGFMQAERVSSKTLEEKINDAIEKEFGLKKIVQRFESPQFYFDRAVIDHLNELKKSMIYQKAKEVLLAEPAILDAWSELDFEKGTGVGEKNRSYFKLFAKQYLKGKSGQLFFLAKPNKMITDYKTGTSHSTPYRYDAQVPLVIHQRLKFKPKEVYEPVSMLSLAATQSLLMGINAPSVANQNFLPGISFGKTG